ncbi:MAG: tRNA (adenosine(37)-N6)-dimethylallyltransferase MiaA, partial [Sphingobacteriales bacterium]
MKKYASKTLLVIAGPTAVGKTAVAISLAKKLGTSIISADSRQCYRELTIGTAKPGQEELKAVHHYFIDAFPASEAVTAADFERLALGYLEEIFSKSDIAIACGGTGLYLKALTEGLDDMPPVDPAIVSELDAQFGEAGLLWLQEQVRTEDPLFFEQAETGNPARLLRALAFVRSTGKSITTYRTGTRKDRDFRIIKIALELPRDLLYKRINRRVDDMMKAG